MLEKMTELELKHYDHAEIILNHFVEDEAGRDLVLRTSQGFQTCHKLMFAASSSFFKQVLSDVPADEPAVVIMTEFTVTEVEDMVDSIYSINRLNSQEEDSRLSNCIIAPPVLAMKYVGEGANEEEDSKTNIKSLSSEPITIVPDIDPANSNFDFLEDLAEPGQSDDPTFNPNPTSSSKRTTRQRRTKQKLTKPEKRPRIKKPVAHRYPMDCPRCQTQLTGLKHKRTHPCLDSSLDDDTKENVGEAVDIICHLCGVRVMSRGALNLHLQMKCENVCLVCKEVFRNRKEVRHHMLNAHHKVLKRKNCSSETPKPFQCVECPRSYMKLHILKQHVAQNHGAPPVKFQCQECGKLMSSKIALKKHVSLHKPPGHSCPICGKLFHNQAYLSRHALSQHAERSNQKHKCDMCEKGFINKAALDGHRNWHLNLKPYQCRWCDRTYQNGSNCAAHERKTHRDEYEAMRKGNLRCQTREILALDVISLIQDPDPALEIPNRILGS